MVEICRLEYTVWYYIIFEFHTAVCEAYMRRSTASVKVVIINDILVRRQIICISINHILERQLTLSTLPIHPQIPMIRLLI